MGVDDENFSAALRAFSEWWDHSQHDSTIMAVIRDFQVKTADLARKAFLAGYAAGKKEKDRTKVPPAIPKGIQDKVNRESKKRVLRPRDVSEIFGIPKGTLANMRYYKKGPKYYKHPGGRGVFYLVGGGGRVVAEQPGSYHRQLEGWAGGVALFPHSLLTHILPMRAETPGRSLPKLWEHQFFLPENLIDIIGSGVRTSSCYP